MKEVYTLDLQLHCYSCSLIAYFEVAYTHCRAALQGEPLQEWEN